MIQDSQSEKPTPVIPIEETNDVPQSELSHEELLSKIEQLENQHQQDQSEIRRLEEENKQLENQHQQDQSEIEQLEIKLNETIFDKMTGAYDRNLFGEEELKKQCLNFKNPLTIALIDIGNFKLINDFGDYEMGDNFLRALVSELQKQVKESDYIVRWGGDEFLLILPNCDEDQKENLNKKIKETGQKIGLDLSVGIVSKKKDEIYKDKEVSLFIKRAEIEMKSQKSESSREKLAQIYS